MSGNQSLNELELGKVQQIGPAALWDIVTQAAEINTGILFGGQTLNFCKRADEVGGTVKAGTFSG